MTPDPALIAAARLDAATSLLVFRATLDALARPGRIAHLPVVRPHRIPAVVLPMLALADLEVSIAVLDDPDRQADPPIPDSPDWLQVVSAATGARPETSPAGADLVLALRAPTDAEIGELRTGDSLAPERGARLIVACARIGRGRTTVELTGPGAARGRRLRVDGPGPELFEALASVNRHFPAGVDTWFVAPDGSIAALPRSAQITHVSSEHDDTGPNDTGPNDTGRSDAGPNDTCRSDTGPNDTGPSDTGPSDPGSDDPGDRLEVVR